MYSSCARAQRLPRRRRAARRRRSATRTSAARARTTRDGSTRRASDRRQRPLGRSPMAPSALTAAARTIGFGIGRRANQGVDDGRRDLRRRTRVRRCVCDRFTRYLPGPPNDVWLCIAARCRRRPAARRAAARCSRPRSRGRSSALRCDRPPAGPVPAASTVSPEPARYIVSASAIDLRAAVAIAPPRVHLRRRPLRGAIVVAGGARVRACRTARCSPAPAAGTCDRAGESAAASSRRSCGS